MKKGNKLLLSTLICISLLLIFSFADEDDLPIPICSSTPETGIILQP